MSATQTGNDRLRVFISYSRRDMIAADAIVRALEDSGFDVLIDRRDLPYGEEWQEELADFIRVCDTIVFLISPASVASKWCGWEVGEVVRLRKRLVPIRIGAVDYASLPPALGKIHIMPVEGTFAVEQHHATLVEVLNTDRAWLKEGTRLADRARQWLAKERDHGLLLRGAGLRDAERWSARPPRTAPPPPGEVLDLILVSRQAAARLQRRIVQGAVGAAVVATGLAGFAFYQRFQAVASRDRAERATGEVVKMSNDIVFDFTGRLRDQAGIPQSFVIDLLKAARKPLDVVSTEARVNPAVALSRALALIELSKHMREQQDLTAAREAIEAAIAQLSVISRDASQVPQWLEARRLAYERMAFAQREAGQLPQARKSLAESLAAAEALAKAAPADVDWRLGLSAARLNMGDNLLATLPRDTAAREAQIGEAERHLQAAFELRRSAAEAANAPLQARSDLATALAKLADLDLARGAADKALQRYQESLALLERLAADNPGNTQLRRDLGVAYQDIARAYEAAGRRTEAIEWLRKDLALSERLADSDKGLLTWQHDLVSSYDRLARGLETAGDKTEALATFRKGLAVAERTAARDRSRPDWQRDLALMLEGTARLQASAGEGGPAVEARRRAITIREGLPRPYSNPAWQRELEIAWRALGEELNRQQRDREGLAAAERYVEVVKAVPQDDPEKPTRLARAQGNLAWASLLANEPARAVEAAQRALADAPQLGWIKANLAHGLLLLGKAEEAKAIYLEGLKPGGKSSADWRASIKGDFDEFRARKLAVPHMEAIEAALQQ